MISEAVNVDVYLDGVSQECVEALRKIRSLIREVCPDLEESMRYGMPSYSRHGVVEVAFNSQKQYIALYLLKPEVVNRYRGRFPRSAVGKGCVRYANPEKIDFDLMRRMLEDHSASNEKPC